MFRLTVRRLCSSGVATAEAITKQLYKILGKQKVPLSSAQSDLPDEMQEALGEEFGGLLSFARQAPEKFRVSKSAEGVWFLQSALPTTFHASLLSSAPAPTPAPAPAPTATRSTDDVEVPKSPVSGHPNANRTLPFARVKHFSLATFTIKNKAFTLPTFAVPMTDLVQFTGADRADELLDAMKKHIIRGAIFVTYHSNTLYVSTAPGAGCEKTNSDFPTHEVPYYDLCRVARHLSCDHPTRLTDLESHLSPMLSKPLVAVLLSFPKRFQCGLADFGWDCVLKDEERILSDANTSTSPLIGEDKLTSSGLGSFSEYASLLRVLYNVAYMVDPDNLAKEAPCSPHYANHTLEEMQQVFVEFNKRADKKSFKAVRERRKIIRSLIAKRFPLGNPLIDPDVTAMCIFDNIENVNGFISSNTVREMLPEGGKITCQTGNDFFRKFPHLFNVTEKSTTELYIQRSDCAPPPRELPLTQPELIFCVVGALPSPLQPNKYFHSSFIAGRLTRHVLNEFKRQNGTLENFLDSFPEVFDHSISKDGKHTYATTPEKLRKWESLALTGFAKAELGEV